MRELPKQKLAATLGEALEMSIAKWDRFATCTLEEYRAWYDQLGLACGLCYYTKENYVGENCEFCPFGSFTAAECGWSCLQVFFNVKSFVIHHYVEDDESLELLARFQDRAGAVRDALEELRGGVDAWVEKMRRFEG